MNKIAVVVRHEFTVTLRRKSFLFMTFVFPAVMVGFLALTVVVSTRGFQGSADITRVAIVDPSNILPKLPETDMTVTRFDSEALAKTALLSDVIQEYYVVPPDYFDTGAILRFTLRRSLAAAETVEEGFLRDWTLANLVPDDASGSLVDRLKDPVNLVSLKLDSTGEVEEQVDEISQFLIPYFFAFLLMMAILISSGYLLQGIGEEKENRIMEVLLSSITPIQFMLGKIWGLGLAGLFQILVWLVAGRIALAVGAVNVDVLKDITYPLDTIALSMAYFFLGYLFFATIMAGLGAVTTTQRESQQIGGIFSFTAIIPFMLAPVLIENPDSSLALALTFIPFTAPVASMIRFASADIAMWQVALSLSVLAASTVFAMWASAKIFRAYLLMYGRRPGLREILASLKAA